jgi:hypothetical protein
VWMRPPPPPPPKGGDELKRPMLSLGLPADPTSGGFFVCGLLGDIPDFGEICPLAALASPLRTSSDNPRYIYIYIYTCICIYQVLVRTNVLRTN